MSLLHALIIAIIQGATELFPVSSLGHAVILPGLLGWDIDQKAPSFLPFLVVLHLGTAVALLAYFWRDWMGFACAVIGRGDADAVRRERRIFFLVCAATLPAVILGFLLEHKLRDVFGTPRLAAIFLIVNGFILFIGEKLRKAGGKTGANEAGTKRIDQIGVGSALAIGACQALALIPGISRSGSTMVGGVLAGLTHKESARFSFLLATPVIAGAGVLEVPKLMHAGGMADMAGGTVIGAGIAAGVTAYVSTVLLMRYFGKHELDALRPFAIYCWLAGAVAVWAL